MPQPTKGPRVGGSPSHQRLIMANLVTQLFEHGKITTTLTRAKRMQPLAEHLIAKAKRGDLHAIRTVGKTVTDKGVLDHLFKQIGPSMKNRDGGFTRITKIGNRQGDAAPMAIIEIVTEQLAPKPAAPKKVAKDVRDKVSESVDEAEAAPADVAEETPAEVAEEAPADVVEEAPADIAAESAEVAEDEASGASADVADVVSDEAEATADGVSETAAPDVADAEDAAAAAE